MKRRRRWFAMLIPLPLCIACALFREGNPATTPKTGPGTDYPCGVYGMLCRDTRPATCCMLGVCANDGEPYCDERPPDDPGDPTQWAARKHVRLPRTPTQ
jgi:hypothetical protein